VVAVSLALLFCASDKYSRLFADCDTLHHRYAGASQW
jgi:hypothetical protein